VEKNTVEPDRPWMTIQRGHMHYMLGNLKLQTHTQNM